LQGLLNISKVGESERVRDQGNILNYMPWFSHLSTQISKGFPLQLNLTS
jgi:hypothetical protein